MSEWFRYAMEAADDGGSGGGEEEPEFHGAFTPEGWRGDVPEVPAEEVEPEAEPASEAEPEAEAPATKPEGWDDSDWADFQKQYPGGTPADLWKHYRELRTRFSRGEHLQPQAEETKPEPEEEEPASWRAHNFQSLGAIPTQGLSVQQRTELGELISLDPEAAAHWAVANYHLLKEEEFHVVQNAWAQADPHGYRTFWQQQEELQRQQAMQEELGPRLEAVDRERQREGAALAEQAIPEITAHIDPFKEWLQARPELDEHLLTLTEPIEVKNALITAFYQFYGPYRMSLDAQEREAAAERERVAQEEAAAAEAAAEQANVRARTARRSAPAAPSGGEASTDDIRAAIMGAGRGSVPQS